MLLRNAEYNGYNQRLDSSESQLRFDYEAKFNRNVYICQTNSADFFRENCMGVMQAYYILYGWLEYYRKACESKHCLEIEALNSIDEISWCMVNCRFSYDYGMVQWN